MATLPFVAIGLQGRHYPIGLKIANLIVPAHALFKATCVSSACDVPYF